MRWSTLALAVAPRRQLRSAELGTEAGGGPRQLSGAVQFNGLRTKFGTEPGLSSGAVLRIAALEAGGEEAELSPGAVL